MVVLTIRYGYLSCNIAITTTSEEVCRISIKNDVSSDSDSSCDMTLSDRGCSNSYVAHTITHWSTNHLFFFAVQLSSVAPMCVQVSMTTDSKNIWRGLDMVPINCDTALVGVYYISLQLYCKVCVVRLNA